MKSLPGSGDRSSKTNCCYESDIEAADLVVFYFSLLQIRHPERSVPAFGDAQSKDPEELVLPIVFRPFQPRKFRQRDFGVEKVRKVSATYKVSGSFDYVARKVRELLRSG